MPYMVEELAGVVMYHYTIGEHWKQMNSGMRGSVYSAKADAYVDGSTLRGLWPTRALIDSRKTPSLPLQAYLPASFGFLEPGAWNDRKEFPRTWTKLMGDIWSQGEDLVLLRVHLLPEDGAYVFDRGHVERLRNMTSETRNEPCVTEKQTLFERVKSFGRGKMAPIRAEMGLVQEAHRRYWDSGIPLGQYDGTYGLAEVVLWKPIPLERIEIVQETPASLFWEFLRTGLIPICPEVV